MRLKSFKNIYQKFSRDDQKWCTKKTTLIYEPPNIWACIQTGIQPIRKKEQCGPVQTLWTYKYPGIHHGQKRLALNQVFNYSPASSRGRDKE